MGSSEAVVVVDELTHRLAWCWRSDQPMKIPTLLLAIGFIFGATVPSNAVPIRYEINWGPGLVVGQFTINIPSGDAVDPFSDVTATDAVGDAFGNPWGTVVYRRYEGTADIFFNDAGNTSLGVGGPIGPGGPLPGRNFAEAWNGLVLRLPLQVVDTPVPDGGATAGLLTLGVGVLGLIRRRQAAPLL